MTMNCRISGSNSAGAPSARNSGLYDDRMPTAPSSSPKISPIITAWVVIRRAASASPAPIRRAMTEDVAMLSPIISVKTP